MSGLIFKGYLVGRELYLLILTHLLVPQITLVGGKPLQELFISLQGCKAVQQSLQDGGHFLRATSCDALSDDGPHVRHHSIVSEVVREGLHPLSQQQD